MKIITGDSLEILKKATPNSVDAIVTDPPYGLSFMGKKWDYDVPSKEIWQECLRVLKPGGYLLAFAGTRTQHRMAVNIEDAGFEIRDMIAWVYGSGFPKSLNIGKAIDKINGRFYDKGFQDYCNEQRKAKKYSHIDVNRLMGTALTGGGFSSSIMGDKEFNELPTTEMYEKLKGILSLDDRYDELVKRVEAEREVIGTGQAGLTSGTIANFAGQKEFDITAPALPEAKQWEGWGTALKPALEPITVARKPLEAKTVAENVLKWGTGGINIDGSRVGTEEITVNRHEGYNSNSLVESTKGKWTGNSEQVTGRFPANFCHDGSDEVVSLFPDTNPSKAGGKSGTTFASGGSRIDPRIGHNDLGGSAARFFYVAKASKADRDEGLEGYEEIEVRGGGGRVADGYTAEQADLKQAASAYGALKAAKKNIHPTVKPTKLMQYLVKLVTPKGGVVLDPFMGSGSTGKACKLEGFEFIGIEREEEYVQIAKARIGL